jgi:hypothetical protein
MLDRRAILTVLALVLVMLACAIGLVGHMAHWSARPFVFPACVIFVVAVLQWRLAHAEGDLSAWTKWGGFVAVSYAALCTAFLLMRVMMVLKVTPLPTLTLLRVFFALYGVQMLILGNWIAKLPPLRMWRPAGLSLDMAGEAAMLRFGGWMFVAYGLVVIISAIVIPMSLIAPLILAMALALLIVGLIRRRQLRHATFGR